MIRTLLRYLVVANAVVLAGAVIAWRVGVLPTPAGVPAVRENVQEFMSSSKSYSFTGLSACGRPVDDSPETINTCSMTHSDWGTTTPSQIPPALHALPTRSPEITRGSKDDSPRPGLVFFVEIALFSEPKLGETPMLRSRDAWTTLDWSAATSPEYSPAVYTLPDPGWPVEFPIRRIPGWLFIGEAVCP